MKTKISDQVAQMYNSWLKFKEFTPRDTQKQMIQCIHDVLRSRDRRAATIQAGTGTGKTIAYSVGTIPFALNQSKHVVIVTATVALQEQIISKDLPELRKAASIPFSFAVAKGRRRYVCTKRLEQATKATNLVDLAEVKGSGRSAGELYQKLFSSFQSGDWSGDMDSWSSSLHPSHWQSISTDSLGCSHNLCTWFDSCPYYVAREQTAMADVIVTNYDLLLSCLRLGSDILPKPEDSIYVLDEAHHLAEKTMAAHTREFRVMTTHSLLLDVVEGMNVFSKQYKADEKFQSYFGSFKEACPSVLELLERLRNLLVTFDYRVDRESTQIARFREGRVPDELKTIVRVLGERMQVMWSATEGIASLLKEIVESPREGFNVQGAMDLLDEYVSTSDFLANAIDLFEDFGRETDDLVSGRWIQHVVEESREEWVLKSVPIEVDEILKSMVWERAFAGICTSATLDVGDDFAHFKSSSGLDASSETLRLESPFDFTKAVTLSIPEMRNEPGGSDSTAHTNEVIKMLPKLLSLERSALVLFTSKSTMDQVAQKLPKETIRHCIIQDQTGKQKLIDEHKRRIDAGESSYLFGMASFREGIDLPGIYCRHVVITRLAFEVPTDPIVESKQELLESDGLQGYQLFRKLQLPGATLKLTQACGRLIRNENDRGRITVLDGRLNSKSYGTTMLNAMPAYRRID